jgi:choline dehydrogenase
VDTYDYIVVGGGSAGCVVANRLSAQVNSRVLLLEAGPAGDTAIIRAPMGALLLYQSARYNWCFWSQEQANLNQRKVFCPQGKGLGGSSAINAMLYVRGNAWDYDHWQRLGNVGWGYRDMLPHFTACEANATFADQYHGTNGELNVQSIVAPQPHAERLLLAALQAGHRFTADFNGRQQEGVGLYQVTCRGARRVTAASAFLDPIRSRSNLRIITNAMVCKIELDGKRATGVSYHDGTRVRTARAGREVIVSAGAFNSPKLLMLSGIGPRAELEQHGIDVIHDLPGVGGNLQEHVDMVIATRSKVADTVALTARRVVAELIRYGSGRAGIISQPFVASGGFIKSSPDLETPDIQLQANSFLFNDHGFDGDIIRRHGYSLHVTLLRPRSRGRISLRSNDHLDDPYIHLNLLNHDEDVRDLTRGVRLAREILRQDAYVRHRGEELHPGEQVQSDVQIASALRAKACHVYHPAGTCKMGHDDLAVVDDQLRVHGLSGLRVIDASIMPTIVSGNTNAAVMAIGAKGAQLILQAGQDSPPTPSRASCLTDAVTV